MRAMNENSWLYYTDWFWYLGWFEHRFAVREVVLPRPRAAPCGARTGRLHAPGPAQDGDFRRGADRRADDAVGARLPDDAVDAAHAYRPAAARFRCAPILCRHAPSRRSRRRSSRPQGGHSPAPVDAFPSWRRRPTRRLCHGRGGRCRGSSFIAMTSAPLVLAAPPQSRDCSWRLAPCAQVRGRMATSSLPFASTKPDAPLASQTTCPDGRRYAGRAADADFFASPTKV